MTALPDYAEALTRALSVVTAVVETEEIPLREAAGRVLRTPVVADRDLPPFNRAEMDGYALRGAEVGRVEAWPVVATIPAGAPADVTVGPGQCVAIATGAPLPDDVDTVIEHERSDRGDPVRFTLDSVETGRAVHRRGADARAGRMIVEPGTVLGPQDLGLCAAVGRSRVEVARRPTACILTSGDEVVDIDTAVAPHEIRNSNAIQTELLLASMGAQMVHHEHVPDDAGWTQAAVGAALPRADVLITVGGISAGERDHFAAAFEEHHVEPVLAGAAIQPGRPIWVGAAPTPPRSAVVVGLPGNPVSALACGCLFVWPIVRRLLGLDPRLPWHPLTLREPVAPNPRRRAFRPARLVADGGVIVPSWAGSGDLAHTAGTDGLAELPRQGGTLAAGSTVRFLPWPSAAR